MQMTCEPIEGERGEESEAINEGKKHILLHFIDSTSNRIPDFT